MTVFVLCIRDSREIENACSIDDDSQKKAVSRTHGPALNGNTNDHITHHVASHRVKYNRLRSPPEQPFHSAMAATDRQRLTSVFTPNFFFFNNSYQTRIQQHAPSARQSRAQNNPSGPLSSSHSSSRRLSTSKSARLLTRHRRVRYKPYNSCNDRSMFLLHLACQVSPRR